jgi:Flp pilus assembly protein TadB
LEWGEKISNTAFVEVHYQQHLGAEQVAESMAIRVLEIPLRLEQPGAASKQVGRPIAMMIRTLQQAKRFLKILSGFTLLALGVVMLVTPGPGWLAILLALGVLAAEFVWARRLLDRLKAQGTRLRETVFPRADRAA